MRGKGFVAWLGSLHGGITPAYAGKRDGSLLRLDGTVDHPRVCGEKTKKIP